MTASGLVTLLLLGAPPAGPPADSQERAALEARLAELVPKVATDPRAACNAGWLRFQLGDLRGAAHDLNDGIARLDTQPDQAHVLAACLYNRGRVNEAEGGTEAARALYVRSLALRPNSTVERRLKALPPPPPPPPWNTRRGAWTEAPAELLPLLAKAERPESISDSPVFLVGLHVTGPQAALSEAWLVWLGDDLRPKGAQFVGDFRVMARVGGALQLSEPLLSLQEGGACYEEADASLELGDDTVGPRIIVRLRHDHIDYEGGHSSSATRTLTALWPESGHLAMRMVTLAESSSFESHDTDDEPSVGVEYALEAALTRDGKLRVTRKSGKVPAEAKATLGVSPLRQPD